MQNVPQILSLSWKIKQDSSGVEYIFEFSLYIDDKIRSVLNNWWFNEDSLFELWFSDWFEWSWFNLEVDKILQLSSSVNTIH